MSQIIYACPCGKVLKYSFKHAGRKARCVECKTEYTVPQSDVDTILDCQAGDTPDLFEKLSIQNTDRRNLHGGEDYVKTDPRSLQAIRPESPRPKVNTPGIRKLKHYRVVSVLSRGGMGRVSLAHDTMLERLVAIKEIRSKYVLNEIYRKRLIQEARITGFLDHPGIVPVHSLEKDETGAPFYVMRRIRGVSFQDAIEKYHREKKQTKLRELLRHFIDVCQIIAYAHSAGVIHRDIKPDNLMLGDFGVTFVLDWGLAKKIVERKNPDELVTEMESMVNENLTQINTRVGTKWHKAPEYLKTGVSHPLNDIYALGMVLYKILTNQLPYDHLQMDEKMALNVCEPKKPHDILRSVAKPLSSICMKAISKNVLLRYNSAAHLADDVQKWLDHEPISAYQYSLLEKIGQFWSQWRR